MGSPVKAAAPPQAYCMPELARLSAQWNFLGFGTPQKPSQQIVNSRIGLTASGPEVTFIRHQLRQAFWDCRHGYVAMAQARAALVAERLHELRCPRNEVRCLRGGSRRVRNEWSRMNSQINGLEEFSRTSGNQSVSKNEWQ
jgi:hypothetical protein